MQDLRKLDSVHEITHVPRPAEGLYLVTGELLNEIRSELDKGQRARWLLEEIVTLGADRSTS